MFGGRQIEYSEIVDEWKLSDGCEIRIMLKQKKPEEVNVEEDTKTALQFWQRVKTYLKQVEGKTRDVWLLNGQSWHQLTDNYRKKVQIIFDKNLGAEWIKVFKDAATKIEEAAPGIEFITDKSDRTMDLLDK